MSAGDEEMERSLRELLSTGTEGSTYHLSITLGEKLPTVTVGIHKWWTGIQVDGFLDFLNSRRDVFISTQSQMLYYSNKNGGSHVCRCVLCCVFRGLIPFTLCVNPLYNLLYCVIDLFV